MTHEIKAYTAFAALGLANLLPAQRALGGAGIVTTPAWAQKRTV